MDKKNIKYINTKGTILGVSEFSLEIIFSYGILGLSRDLRENRFVLRAYCLGFHENR